MKRQTRFQHPGFIESALTPEGQFIAVTELLDEYRHLSANSQFVVQQIPFSEFDHWVFMNEPYRLTHRSGRFFTVGGIHVCTNYGPVGEWDQPIIHQPEIGILGIITKVFNGVRYFLMQDKMEPGNVNLIQLSPTVQATQSNYKQVHHGKPTLYLDYFTKPGKSARLIDQLQTEQGHYFLRKRNRNIVVEVTDDVPLYAHFHWLTLGQIQQLLTYDNLVHMDTRTVLSCIPLISPELQTDTLYTESQWIGFTQESYQSMPDAGIACHSMTDILSWLIDLKMTYELSVQSIPLNQMRHWVVTSNAIQPTNGPSFSVIAVFVQAENREVPNWTQPLLQPAGDGLVGFLTQNIGDALHVLVRANVEPGNFDTIDLGPTVACSKVAADNPPNDANHFLNLFLAAPPEQIRYSTVLSEEGGRFYQYQNRYMIVELPPDYWLDIPDHFIWMTLAQLQKLLPHGYVTIEARSLLTCFDFSRKD